MSGPARRIGWGLAGLAVGFSGGAICAALHTPLPWMIGPLVGMAVLKTLGVPLGSLRGGRETGQLIIATALGLYFTPEIAREVVDTWALLLLAAAFATALGYGSGWLLWRFGGVDRTTALFASVPGGATEMAVLGERFGGKPDRIALAQSLRILMVVVLVPSMFAFLGVRGSDAYLPASSSWSAEGLAIQLACAATGGVLFRLFRAPNAWMLGPLAVTIGLTASGIDFSAIPGPLSAVGQVLLGVALGSRFEREFIRSAPGFVLIVALSILAAMLVAAIFGAGLAWLGGLAVPTMVLATAPGGIAEMCITAKVLQLGVPTVTAAHVTRVIILVTTTAPLFRAARALKTRESA